MSTLLIHVNSETQKKSIASRIAEETIETFIAQLDLYYQSNEEIDEEQFYDIMQAICDKFYAQFGITLNFN